jgi:hypothetical protein
MIRVGIILAWLRSKGLAPGFIHIWKSILLASAGLESYLKYHIDMKYHSIYSSATPFQLHAFAYGRKFCLDNRGGCRW